MTIKEKILAFLKKKSINQLDFFENTGISASNFKGKAKESELGGDKIAKILTLYPNISPDWLLMDKGEMERIPLYDRLSFVINVIGDVDKTASYLEVSNKELLNFTNNFISPNKSFNLDNLIFEIPEFSREWLFEGIGKPFKGENEDFYIAQIQDRMFKIDQKTFVKEMEEGFPVAIPATQPGEGIPLIPIEAMAGALTSDQTVLEYECERYVVPMFKGADFLIPVKGSSMYPKYSSGDIVACQRVSMSDLFFQWNKVYVIDTNQGALIKRIKPGSDKDHVLIVSDNEKYDPFELPFSAIHAVALVIGVIRLE